MEDAHSTLLRVEKRMALSEKDRVAAMKHLGRIRDAIEDMAQEDEIGEDALSLEDVILDDEPQDAPATEAPPEERVELLVDGQVVELEGA